MGSERCALERAREKTRAAGAGFKCASRSFSSRGREIDALTMRPLGRKGEQIARESPDANPERGAPCAKDEAPKMANAAQRRSLKPKKKRAAAIPRRVSRVWSSRESLELSR